MGGRVSEYCIYDLAPVSLNVLSLFYASVPFFRLIWDHVLPQFILIIGSLSNYNDEHNEDFKKKQ